MGIWRKILEANFKPIAWVPIKGRNRQGDAVSHCCSAQVWTASVRSLTRLVSDTDYDIIHFLYMNAMSEQDIGSLIHTTLFYSSGISCKLEKCRWMVRKQGKVVRTEAITLPEGNGVNIKEYLWIPRASGNHEEAARKAASTKYIQSNQSPQLN